MADEIGLQRKSSICANAPDLHHTFGIAGSQKLPVLSCEGERLDPGIVSVRNRKERLASAIEHDHAVFDRECEPVARGMEGDLAGTLNRMHHRG